MSIFFSIPCSDFSGNDMRITISTGPVIIHSDGDRVLLHISSSTGKYQFIGGRLDDTLSFQENALMRAREVVGDNQIHLFDLDPTILLDTIERAGQIESILLIHYGASIADENNIGDAQWFTLSQIHDLSKQNQISSPNVMICSAHFLKQ